MKTEIVIVGAGLAGAATAYHLKRLGVSGVVLLEKESAPGQHSSGRNAAMVREKLDDPDIQVLNTEGANMLRSGDFCTFRQTGSLLLGWGDEDTSRHFSPASGQGLWCPDDGIADPAGLLHTYLRSQTVLCNTQMLAWKPTGEGVTVQTDSGEISAGLLVNAAGAWAGVVGDLPLKPASRHLFLTPPMTTIEPHWPFVWDIVHGLYFRPESGGLLLCACDEETREPGDYSVNHDVQTTLAEVLERFQPGLAHVAIKMSWTGQRTFCADRKFVIGFDPRCPSLFHVAGLGGHGVTASYAIGRQAAELLVAGQQSQSNAFDPARLMNGSTVARHTDAT